MRIIHERKFFPLLFLDDKLCLIVYDQRTTGPSIYGSVCISLCVSVAGALHVSWSVAFRCVADVYEVLSLWCNCLCKEECACM